MKRNRRGALCEREPKQGGSTSARGRRTRSSCGPNEPMMWVMSFPITIALRPAGYSGVKNSMIHATMPIVLAPASDTGARWSGRRHRGHAHARGRACVFAPAGRHTSCRRSFSSRMSSLAFISVGGTLTLGNCATCFCQSCPRGHDAFANARTGQPRFCGAGAHNDSALLGARNARPRAHAPCERPAGTAPENRRCRWCRTGVPSSAWAAATP